MVKCRDCGRLGVLDEYTDKLCEATKQTRETGWHQSSQGNATPATITCCAGIQDFSDSNNRTATQTVSEISTEIGLCPSFKKWIPGIDPERIEEMAIQEQLISIQQSMLELQRSTFAWRREQAEESRKWESRIHALEEVRHQETTGISRQSIGISKVAIAALIISSILGGAVSGWISGSLAVRNSTTSQQSHEAGK